MLLPWEKHGVVIIFRNNLVGIFKQLSFQALREVRWAHGRKKRNWYNKLINYDRHNCRPGTFWSSDKKKHNNRRICQQNFGHTEEPDPLFFICVKKNNELKILEHWIKNKCIRKQLKNMSVRVYLTRFKVLAISTSVLTAFLLYFLTDHAKITIQVLKMIELRNHFH